MDLTQLFRDHITEVCRMAERSLAVFEAEGGRCEGIVLHAGARGFYPSDDLAVPFRSFPHFARFAPIEGPDHLLLFRPGEPLRLARVVSSDYWEEPHLLPDHPMAEVLEIAEAPSLEAAATLLGDLSRCAYVGPSPAVSGRLGIPDATAVPPGLVSVLDWHRAFKTAYEVHCIREANRIAARGHRAARRGMAEGRSEREIHAAYLAATAALENETPYPNIIAWDDRSSVLHYQGKRTSPPSPAHTFLIDSGASVYGYASDVTRTYVREGVHPVFSEALDRMEALQRSLFGLMEPGGSYVDLHAQAVFGVASIVCDLGILRVPPEEAFETGLVLPFMPHGLGHHLGLQVHDVGGQQVAPAGERRPPPHEHPSLRTTRDLDFGHVVTLEPGLYFIAQLLEPFRTGPPAAAFDWKLVDALLPSGGIRIEDDVHMAEDGPENLTRGFLPGHLDEVGDPA
jgi:Xaa-Pro dipeptidase